MRILILAISAAALAASAAFAQVPANHPPTQEEPGKPQVEAACTGCHDLSVIAAQHNSKSRWNEIVQEMIGRGAPVSDADYDKVVGYLAKTYGEAS